MAFHVTQCPSCESTFNTSARILESAAGRVRCGACLTVFNAADHLVRPEDADDSDGGSVFVGNVPQDYFDPFDFLSRSAEPEQIAAPAAADRPEEAREATVTGNGGGIFDGLELGAALEDIAAADTRRQEPAEPEPDSGIGREHTIREVPERQAGEQPRGGEERVDFSARSDTEVHPPSFDQRSATTRITPGPAGAAGDDPDLPSVEEFITEAGPARVGIDRLKPEDLELSLSFSMFHGAQETAAPPEDSLAQQAAAAAAAMQDATAPEPPEEAAVSPLPVAEKDIVEIGETQTETPDDLQLQQEIAEFDFQETLAEGLTLTEVDFDTALFGDSGENFRQQELQPRQDSVADQGEAPEESTESIRARALQTALDDEGRLESLPEENLAALASMDAPVELVAGQRRRLGRRVALLCCVLLLGATLAGQYLWRFMDVYNQDPRLRPLYELACARLRCELPPYTDIAAIRSDNLDVRSHPERDNGLLVSINFRNTAPFPQPFPVMILSFNSVTDDIVALREFAPTEYLDPVLAAMGEMPAMTPVQVNLEVIDPGPGAVSYTLAFRSP